MANGKTVPELEALREHITTLFATAPTSSHKRSIGLELETLPLKNCQEGIPKSVDISNDNKTGVCDILQNTATLNSELTFSPQADGTPLFISKNGGNITFEPGGQVEYSTSECYHLKEAIQEMVKYVKIIRKAMGDNEIDIFHGGINPWHSVETVGLKMKKPRYRKMDNYFQALGPYGQQMMRLTLSIQVNLDFGDYRTARKRWFAANLLAPIMCAVFGNSPFIQGRVTENKSYRSFIWQHMDRCRTGFPNPENLSCPEMDQIDQYLIYALDAYVVKLHADAVEYGEKNRFISFRDWMSGNHPRLRPDMDDWKNHISLLFPEVRPKGFLEFRTLDGPSENWWTIPVVLLSSILYDNQAMEQVLELMDPYCQHLEKMMKQAAQSGVSAFPDLTTKVFEIALNSGYSEISPDLCDHCERFFTTLTRQGKNPADQLLTINNGRIFSLDQFKDFEQKSRESLSPPEYTIFS